MAAGDLSSVDLIDSCLRRIQLTEPQLHAFEFIDVEGARRRARSLAEEAARGETRGPLHRGLTRSSQGELVSAEDSGLRTETVAALRYAETIDEATVADATEMLPTTPILAPLHSEASGLNRVGISRSTGPLARYRGPMNWCNVATLTMPIGFTTTGMPIGAQIVGAEEDVVLALCETCQAATNHHTVAPPI